MGRIITNKIKCNKCGQIIESTYTHDFVMCNCGCSAVDGGKSYLKRNFTPEYGYTEMCETEE